MSDSRNLLRLNVGFIVHQTVGYFRDFPFNVPTIRLSPDLDLENLNGTVRVTRTAQGLLVQTRMQAQTAAECVRCLSDFAQALEIDFTELYAFTIHSVTDSGLLVPESGKLDLAPLIREEMLLAMPIKSLCKPGCKGLCPVCGENLNESICDHGHETVDYKLGAFKSLLDKNNPSF